MTTRTTVHGAAAPALGIRDAYIATVAAEHGYEMTRVSNGYRLKRYGASKIYQTATGCLTALTTGNNLPTKRAAAAPAPKPVPVSALVPDLAPEPVPMSRAQDGVLAGYTLTPGDKPLGGVWLARLGCCQWHPDMASVIGAIGRGFPWPIIGSGL